jgi:hypothetical protein
MEKVVFLLWRRPDHALARVDDWLVHQVVSSLDRDRDVLGARVLVEAGDLPTAMAPSAKSPEGILCGAVSLWLHTYQERVPIQDLLQAGPISAVHAWLVTESVPLAYGARLDWPLRTRSPGLTQLTALDKRPDITDDRFFHLWHNVHRRTTAEVHPLACYVRNEVVRPLTEGAPTIRGIVYESALDPQDMLDPARFFGSAGDEKLLRANAARVMDETTAFIHYDTMQTAYMHEYLVRVVST